MIFETFVQLLPILIITAGGVVLDRIFSLDLDSLVKIITDFFMPMLIFHALYTSSIEGKLVIDLAGAVTVIVLLLTLLSFFFAKITKINAGSFIPSIIFMNSGFLGIPLMKLWGGMSAMNMIVIYDQIQTIYIFTLGILIITGGFSRKSFFNIIQSPILWAVFLGFSFRFLGVPVAEPLLNTVEFGGSAAPPLAALALGVSLGETRIRIQRSLAAGLVLRIVGGFLCGLLASEMFGLEGLSRTIVIAASSLPSAVFTSVLPMRYGVRSDFAGAMVVVSTIIGIISIPITFRLAELV